MGVQIIPQDVGPAARFFGGFLPQLGEGFAQGAQQGMGLQQQIAANIEQQRQNYQLRSEIGQETASKLLNLTSNMPKGPAKDYVTNLAKMYGAFSGDPQAQNLMNTMLPYMQNQAQAEAMGLGGENIPQTAQPGGAPPSTTMPDFSTAYAPRQPSPQSPMNFQQYAPPQPGQNIPNVEPLDPYDNAKPRPVTNVPATPQQLNQYNQPQVQNNSDYSQIPQGEELTEGGAPERFIPRQQKRVPNLLTDPSRLDNIARTYGPAAALQWANYAEKKAEMGLKQAKLENDMLKAEMEKKATILSDGALSSYMDNASPDVFRWAENYIASNDNKSPDTIQNELNDHFKSFEKSRTRTENYLNQNDALLSGNLNMEDVDSLRTINEPLIKAGLYDEVVGELLSHGINQVDSQLVIDPPSKDIKSMLEKVPDLPGKFGKQLKDADKKGVDVSEYMKKWNDMKKNQMIPIAKNAFRKAGGKTNPLSVRAMLKQKDYPDEVVIQAWNEVKKDIDYIPYYRQLGAAYMNRSDIDINTENDMLQHSWKNIKAFGSQLLKRYGYGQ